MEGTRKSLLKGIIGWVTNRPERTDGGNTYWIYGLPGIGKTSLAHSICANLDDQEQLAGAFFCRTDNSELSKPRNILPTLIHKLARIFPPFRCVVAERLRKDPILTTELMETLLLDSLCKLPRLPKRTLVFVIDALDECDNAQDYPDILKALTSATAHAPWLKIIITSRPKRNIQYCFDALNPSTHCRYDLTADNETTSDLRIFAKDRLNRVAFKWCLQTPWPEQALFDSMISQAEGLFIFIETIALALEQCDDPNELFKATLRDSAGTGLTSLYRLYSSILKARIMHHNAEFRRVIGVLLITAPNRPLCEDTIAELVGVRPGLAKMWVASLRPMLYQDEDAGGGIRVRHLTVSDFFLSDDNKGDFRVNLRDVNLQLGITCLKKMVEQLRFNICKLEDSRLANDDVKDLPSRIKENISDALQYSSLYWSNHLCFTPDIGYRAWESLWEFFSGLHPLFWIEVLSIMGMLRIGVRSLQKVISTLVKVSTSLSSWPSKVVLTCCRMQIYPSWKKFRMSVVS